MKMIPLDKTPQYYNQTFMYELVLGGNEIARLNALDLASKYTDARICEYSSFIFTVALPTLTFRFPTRCNFFLQPGVFDSHTLFTDMINNPAQFLNGTDPLNVVGDIFGLNIPAGPRRDSYLW